MKKTVGLNSVRSVFTLWGRKKNKKKNIIISISCLNQNHSDFNTSKKINQNKSYSALELEDYKSSLGYLNLLMYRIEEHFYLKRTSFSVGKSTVYLGYTTTKSTEDFFYPNQKINDLLHSLSASEMQEILAYYPYLKEPVFKYSFNAIKTSLIGVLSEVFLYNTLLKNPLTSKVRQSDLSFFLNKLINLLGSEKGLSLIKLNKNKHNTFEEIIISIFSLLNQKNSAASLSQPNLEEVKEKILELELEKNIHISILSISVADSSISVAEENILIFLLELLSFSLLQAGFFYSEEGRELMYYTHSNSSLTSFLLPKPILAYLPDEREKHKNLRISIGQKLNKNKLKLDLYRGVTLLLPNSLPSFSVPENEALFESPLFDFDANNFNLHNFPLDNLPFGKSSSVPLLHLHPLPPPFGGGLRGDGKGQCSTELEKEGLDTQKQKNLIRIIKEQIPLYLEELDQFFSFSMKSFFLIFVTFSIFSMTFNFSVSPCQAMQNSSQSNSSKVHLSKYRFRRIQTRHGLSPQISPEKKKNLEKNQPSLILPQALGRQPSTQFLFPSRNRALLSSTINVQTKQKIAIYQRDLLPPSSGRPLLPTIRSTQNQDQITDYKRNLFDYSYTERLAFEDFRRKHAIKEEPLLNVERLDSILNKNNRILLTEVTEYVDTFSKETSEEFHNELASILQKRQEENKKYIYELIKHSKLLLKSFNTNKTNPLFTPTNFKLELDQLVEKTLLRIYYTDYSILYHELAFDLQQREFSKRIEDVEKAKQGLAFEYLDVVNTSLQYKFMPVNQKTKQSKSIATLGKTIVTGLEVVGKTISPASNPVIITESLTKLGFAVAELYEKGEDGMIHTDGSIPPIPQETKITARFTAFKKTFETVYKSKFKDIESDSLDEDSNFKDNLYMELESSLVRLWLHEERFEELLFKEENQKISIQQLGATTLGNGNAYKTKR
jgi:hypothetical protein